MASAEQALSNNTDRIDQQKFVDSVNKSFFTWIFQTLVPKVVLGLYVLLLICGMGTNALLVGVALNSKLYKHPVHVFLLQLSMLDILACFSVVLPTLVTVAQGQTSGSRSLWEDGDNGGGNGLCKLHAFLFIWFFLLTFILYDIMIIERASHAVAAGTKIHLQTFGNPCFVRLVSIAFWTLTLLVALVLMLSDHVKYREDQYQCGLDFPEHSGAMHALFSLTIYSSPVVVLVSMCVVFCTRRRRLQSEQPISGTDASASKVDESDGPCSSDIRNKKDSGLTKIIACDNAKEMFNLKSKRKIADLKNSFHRYMFSQHTERIGANTTSVFNVERVRPDVLLEPIMKPLHRSNVRVGVAKDIGNHGERQFARKESTEVFASDHLDGREPSPTKTTSERRNVKTRMLAMPEFRSKQLWVKARGVLAVRNTPLNVFRDVPHDVHHHQSMTYLISWAVTYLLWVVYVIAAFVEVYNGGQTCHACYRAGVLLGLSSYSVRPLVLVGHNRWYREQCRQELKKAKICLKKRCNCCCGAQ
ncbi:hypothetical protein RRG08_007098 [Elysia crispata]|uniref:G-protein coupled receptors family 1 profile domain-containing protein n=1 Tax=Elysia crispata TaxID=231223 RepID=A0AAE0YLX3_9GAST|nr:hypothetical protein RRG08_007098 [Elysia crispata]